VAPDRWILKGALALDYRLGVATRATKDIDLGRDDNETAAIDAVVAAQQLALDDFFTFAALRTDDIVTRRGEAGQPARSWRAATQGLPPGLVVVAAVAVIVVLVPVLVTIAQAFGGGPTGRVQRDQGHVCNHFAAPHGPCDRPRRREPSGSPRPGRRFTAADVRV
jgi:Nucleotidyl transferase AbiEii toxin, Type IV TA system